MTAQPTVEAVLLRLKEGTDEAAFVAAAAAMRPALEAAGGYLGRQLARTEDGRWLDLLLWSTLEQAERAAEAMPSWPSSGPFLDLIDGDSVTLLHLRRVYADGHAEPNATPSVP